MPQRAVRAPVCPSRLGVPLSSLGKASKPHYAQWGTGPFAAPGSASRGAVLAPAPEGAAWHRGCRLAPAPGTACSAAFTPPGSAPRPAPRVPARLGGQGCPDPALAALPLPEPPPLCLPDHREAPGTYPEQGFPGGGDALSVPGTQVRQGSHCSPPCGHREWAETRLVLMTPMGTARPPSAPGSLPLAPLAAVEHPDGTGDIQWFAMTTGPRWPNWSRAEPPLLSGAVCAGPCAGPGCEPGGAVSN